MSLFWAVDRSAKELDAAYVSIATVLRSSGFRSRREDHIDSRQRSFAQLGARQLAVSPSNEDIRL